MAEISQFQPLFPEERVLGPLQEIAAELIRECQTLRGLAGDSMVRALSPRLRAMNSYYTNKIEGQHTRPAEIERALKNEFNADTALAKKQRIAVAHMEVEQESERAFATADAADVFFPRVVCEIHRSLYTKLPESDRFSDDGVAIVPGGYRTKDVTAGRHLAPKWSEVDGLMVGWAERYRTLTGAEALLIGAACSHHRLAWVHPFIDGNGRAARLHTHVVLHAMGLTLGLWSPMRGLARTQEQYYAKLSNADASRRNDLDGRGALSQEELVAFARYFLEVCIDQVRFMRDKLDFATLKDRLKSMLLFLQAQPWNIGSEKSVVKIDALEALHYIAISGPIERSTFIKMTGLGERTGRRALASLLDFGILTATSSRSDVSFGVPPAALRYLFPNLWPEAEVDGD